jgi:hypothetical protein
VRIDEMAGRINGMIVTVLLVVALLTQSPLVIAYLLADFTLKVFVGFSTSPNCRLARLIARALHLPKRPIDAAPKRFAATIGLALSIVALGLTYVPHSEVALTAVLLVFVFCAALEGFFGVCLGCMLYGVLPQKVARVFVEHIR